MRGVRMVGVRAVLLRGGVLKHRYSVYLLCWYKSTHTDTEALRRRTRWISPRVSLIAISCRGRWPLVVLSLLGLLVQKCKSANTDTLGARGQLTRQARETLLQKLRGSYVSSVLSNLYDCMVANIESRDGALVSDVLRPLVLAGATQLQLSSADVVV